MQSWAIALERVSSWRLLCWYVCVFALVSFVLPVHCLAEFGTRAQGDPTLTEARVNLGNIIKDYQVTASS